MVAVSIASLGPRAEHQVVGFLDDDPAKHGQTLDGLPVLGPISELERVAKKNHVDTVLVCFAGARSTWLQDLMQRCHAVGVSNVRVVPAVSQLADRPVTAEGARPPTLEDLLVREPVAVDRDALRTRLAGRRILITGAAGTIGSELARQIELYRPARLVLLDTDESRLHDLQMELLERESSTQIEPALVDLRDEAHVQGIMQREKPQIVFHAAAYKHVPMMERHPLAALDVNVLGTARLFEASLEAGVERFVFISTDKAVEPSTVMGLSKRIAEIIVLEGRPGKPAIGTAVRFGNVLGSRGSVVPTFERQIEQGGPVTVTHPDVERFFMMTSEAVALVLQAAVMGSGGDLFMLDMGKPIRILDLAKAMLERRGKQNLEIRFVGLRQGEKLSEVLAYPYERAIKTAHPRIHALQVVLPQTVAQLVAEAKVAAQERTEEAARAYFAAVSRKLKIQEPS
jgi:FlaA1/EpsC-like NDP-sugar epimerase